MVFDIITILGVIASLLIGVKELFKAVVEKFSTKRTDT